MNGVSTSAVLVERLAKCQAEFQPKGESRRKEAMDCESAYAFRAAAGSKKVRVHKTEYATVRYALSDGSSHTATVYEGRVETRELPVGSTFEAVYDPANPGDVRAQPTFSSAAYHLMMVAGGLVMLGLALLPQVIGLFGRDASHSADARDAGAWGEDALKEAIARHQPAAQRCGRRGLRPVRARRGRRSRSAAAVRHTGRLAGPTSTCPYRPSALARWRLRSAGLRRGGNLVHRGRFRMGTQAEGPAYLSQRGAPVGNRAASALCQGQHRQKTIASWEIHA